MKKTALLLALIMILTAFAGCAKTDADKNNDPSKETKSEETAKEDALSSDPSADADDKDGKGDKDDKGEIAGDKEEGSDNKGSADTEKESSSGSGDKDSSSDGKNDDKNHGGDKGGKDKDTSSKNEDTREEYYDGVILEAYIAVCAPYLYEEHKKGADLSDVDLFHLTAQFIYSQMPSHTVSPENDGNKYGIKASELEETFKILFGSKLSLSDFKGYMDEKVGDSYDEGSDTYYFDKNVVTYSDSGYYLSFDDEMKIKEDADNITAKVTLVNDNGKKSTLTYEFEKDVEDGYLYVRLIKISK